MQEHTGLLSSQLNFSASRKFSGIPELWYSSSPSSSPWASPRDLGWALATTSHPPFDSRSYSACWVSWRCQPCWYRSPVTDVSNRPLTTTFSGVFLQGNLSSVFHDFTIILYSLSIGFLQELLIQARIIEAKIDITMLIKGFANSISKEKYIWC